MDPLTLTVIGWIIAVGIAVWQNRRADRAEKERKAAIDSMPLRVAEETRKILGVVSAVSDELASPELARLSQLIQLKDVDGDGRDELLVQGPEGAHGSKLKILKIDYEGMDFYEMDELSTEAGGFDIGDLDGDGRTEISVLELDWFAPGDLSYVEMPRIQVVYRWDGQRFSEISRQKLE